MSAPRGPEPSLDDEAVPEAGFVAVMGGSTKVQPFGEWTPRALEPLELLHEIAARTALRGQIRRADPTDPHRYETRLRAVGVALDAQPRQAYRLLVSRQTVVAEGSAGYFKLFTAERLAPLLRSLRAGRFNFALLADFGEFAVFNDKGRVFDRRAVARN